MERGNSIYELFQSRKELPFRERFPFTVKEKSWSKGFYVVVQYMIDTPYHERVALGIPYKNGEVSRLYIKDQRWLHGFYIPKADQPVWENVEDVSLDHYKTFHSGYYETNSILKWGKYEGMSIEEICQINPGYLRWCIDNLFHNFCIVLEAMDDLLANGFKLDAASIKLNEQKIKWYESDYSDALIPEFYKDLNIARTPLIRIYDNDSGTGEPKKVGAEDDPF